MEYTQNIPWYKNDYLNYPFRKEESLHYVFYFQNDSLSEKDIKEIIKLKEEHYLKILSFLELYNNRKINYYIYPSIKEKSLLMGDDSPGNAIWEKLENNNPNKFEIHVVYNEKCKFVGEHEDTHLLSLPWGLSIYLFCEGLAQYMENVFLNKDLHSAAKELMEGKKLYSIEFLCDNNNWEHVEPTIIYPQAGSFAKFIIEKYGKDKFGELYRNTSRHFETSKNLSEIERIYDKTINQLEQEWLDHKL
jgi:hypothetical protein